MQDGQQLPSPVKFDLPVSAGQLPPVEVGCLPDSVNTQIPISTHLLYTLLNSELFFFSFLLQKSYLVNDEVKGLVVTFLEQ